ncbi:hypothetical protein [Nocardia seriolae]|uniref:Uncharacterized protein n=1 Tax=Nocardia seriolae TaxID=37332 RepID=A0A0B8NL09_9NOCA|nr:hypothetical protein [Nocardia seriolae]APA95628.1 hypothetical protein NS506_01557 [Nocardia seriolae]MTJ66241.1 hypothetical protein [Nocardia seriolae]MTJ74447.1 hypothetical protein [Nocardia seriolae]MTJ85846.1 hypothetical protein [Nocardia seriolae]MTK29842.1 hypothetical protein [Nocardia seriolae]
MDGAPGPNGATSENRYVIKILPKVAVSKFVGEQWVPTGALSQKLTMVAFEDDAAGFAVAHTYAGKGWQQVLAQTGMPYTITALTASIVGPTTLAEGNTSQSTQVVVKDQWGGIVAPSLLNCTGVTALTATVTPAGLVTPTADGTGGTGAVNVALNLPSGWPASTATATPPAITVA